TGSRMMPLTKVTNKHLLPVGRKPMIYYPIEKLRGCGIKHILIVTGVEHMGDVVGLLGSGREFGVEFTYRVQDEAGGIAQALALAETFAAGDKVCVILGDNIVEDSLSGFAEAFREQPRGAKVILKEVPDPKRFGVADVQDGKVLGIEEKPDQPKSNLAVTGLYFYDNQVFDIIRMQRPSDRGEMEITDVNNEYLRRGELSYDVLSGWWSDAGTFESWGRVQSLTAERPPK
ncbi:MAG: sugar phosphate nucleotidyltransferase, partial [Phycisphaerae bacterium]